jgi:hypothetical protein
MLFKRVKILESRVNALEAKVREQGNPTSKDSALQIRTRKAFRTTAPTQKK